MSEWRKHLCVCDECGYEWVGLVNDENMNYLECPLCHMMSGRVADTNQKKSTKI